jgi:hypothetical protein
VQRERQRSGAALIRDLREGGMRNDPRRSDYPTCVHLSADLGQARDRCLQRIISHALKLAQTAKLVRACFMLRSARDTAS